MRHRYVADPFPCINWLDGRSGAYPTISDDRKVGMVWARVSTIDDVQPAEHTRNNFCEHSKLKSSLFHEGTSTRHTNAGPGGSDWSHRFRAGCYPTDWGNYLNVPAYDWVSLTVKLAQSVKGFLKSKALLGVSFQELHKTVEMMRNPFQLLRRMYRHRPVQTTFRRLADKGSNVWLEYNYGWRAFKYDLDNLVQAVGRHYGTSSPFSTPEHWSRFASSGKIVNVTPAPTISDAAWASMLDSAANPETSSGSATGGVRIVWCAPTINYRVGCRSLDTIAGHANKFTRLVDSLGLNMDHVLQTFWEIVPYSFVIDWFFNLDGLMNLPRYSSALLTLSQASVRDLCYSTKVESQFHAEWFPQYGGFYGLSHESYWGYGNPDRVFCSPPVRRGSDGTIVVFRRYPNFPPADVGTVFGGFGLSVAQGVSGAALITQRVRRR